MVYDKEGEKSQSGKTRWIYGLLIFQTITIVALGVSYLATFHENSLIMGKMERLLEKPAATSVNALAPAPAPAPVPVSAPDASPTAHLSDGASKGSAEEDVHAPRENAGPVKVSPPPGMDMTDPDNQVMLRIGDLLSRTGHVYSSDFEGLHNQELKERVIKTLSAPIKTKSGQKYVPFIEGNRQETEANLQKATKSRIANEILESPRHGAPPGESTDSYENEEELNRDYPVVDESVLKKK